MSLETKIYCEICSRLTDEDDIVCKDCYSDLEEQIKELEEKIDKLKEKL